MSAKGKVESSNVKVMTRMRMFNDKEIKKNIKLGLDKLNPCVKMRGNTCAIVEYNTDNRGFTHEREKEAFDFDECFWSMPFDQYPLSDKDYADQLYVYQRSGALALQAALEGFHVCIFAYGQTSSGKTYSMLGSDKDPGISPRLVDDLFTHIQRNTNPALQFKVECMFFEIYNERVRDLFVKTVDRNKAQYDNPRIRTHNMKGVYVEGLVQREVTTAEQTKNFMKNGMEARSVAPTQMNDTSSRSHAIFQINVTQMDALRGTKRTSFLNLVDLAGSERISQSLVTGSSLVEATNINKSLSTLRRVIDVLIENSTSRKQQVAPFRDSVLTYVLSESLGGNSKTQMIATISPHVSNIEDTINTLRYALRAKSIVNSARVNEEESAAMMNQMRDEIMRLRIQMRDGVVSGTGVGGAVPVELQQELQEKEAEMARMEQEQSRMETLMVELKSQVKEMNEAKEELAVAVTEQRRERFAAAFRNAFLISTDKKRIEAHELDLTNLRRENEVMRAKITSQSVQIEEGSKHAHELVVENHALSQSLQHLTHEFEAKTSQMTIKSRSQDEMIASLEHKLEEKEAGLATEVHSTGELKRKLENLTMDLTGLTNTAEREALEKNRVRSAFEASVMQHLADTEALRRRKEAHKQTVADERQRSAVLRKAISSHEDERQSLLATIKALQSVIREKDFLVASANSACEEARRMAEELRSEVAEKDQLIRSLLAAVEEYKNASGKWMAELTVRDREVARLRGMSATSDFPDAHGLKAAWALQQQSPLTASSVRRTHDVLPSSASARRTPQRSPSRQTVHTPVVSQPLTPLRYSSSPIRRSVR